MLSQYRISVAVLFFLVFITPTSHSQQNTPSVSASDLAMLSVTVRNRDGQNLTGLSREAFELTDEKEVRAIEFFENTDSPLSIGILVDTSPSMRFFEVNETARATAIGEVISRFLQLGNTDNEYFVLAFGQVPRLLTDWTTGTSLLAQKTEVVVEAKGNTALYDA